MKSIAGRFCTDISQQRQPVHPRQPNVADDDVDRPRLNDRQSFDAVAGFDHLVTGIGQSFGQGNTEIGLVIDEQNLNGTCEVSLSEDVVEARVEQPGLLPARPNCVFRECRRHPSCARCDRLAALQGE